MKIVIAPDSFKGSLTAKEVGEAIQAGLKQVWPEAEYVLVPMADGGEGTVQALVDATGDFFPEFVRQDVTDFALPRCALASFSTTHIVVP